MKVRIESSGKVIKIFCWSLSVEGGRNFFMYGYNNQKINSPVLSFAVNIFNYSLHLGCFKEGSQINVSLYREER
jgi:hypothetical protein